MGSSGASSKAVWVGVVFVSTSCCFKVFSVQLPMPLLEAASALTFAARQRPSRVLHLARWPWPHWESSMTDLICDRSSCQCHLMYTEVYNSVAMLSTWDHDTSPH